MYDRIFWGVLGSVILDIDVILFPLSDPFPSLFIFTHGGITHTLIGAMVVSVFAFMGIRKFLTGPFMQDRILPRFPQMGENIMKSSWALIPVLAGAYLHTLLDCCASPGLPLLYPVSAQKVTLGILSGSSGILLAMSLVFTIFFLRGRITPRHVKIYTTLFLVVLLFSAGMKLYVSTTSTGRSIPTLNPFSWLIIEENDTAYQVGEYDIFSGISNTTIFEKYQNISPDEAAPYMHVPEVRRLNYFSYMWVVEKNSTAVILYDPLRTGQTLWYPPYYASVELQVGMPG